jgi:hypothetical protein
MHINTFGYMYVLVLIICVLKYPEFCLTDHFVRNNFTLFDCVRSPSTNEKSLQKRRNFMFLVSCLINSINKRSLSCLIQRTELYLISVNMEIVMEISKPQKALY